MDATTRWETEAMRSTPQQRSNPPRPSAKRQIKVPDAGTFLTLKETEDATGIPMSTLRKWIRKDAITSHLESDGETTLRMVELGSVRARATELGRELTNNREPEPEDHPTADVEALSTTPEGSMLVPIDAWNKMLTQLGNLHEAGQQLAEARERAAKAETEAAFLRERLTEMRQQGAHEQPADPPRVTVVDDEPSAEPETTTYWSYLTTGWRNRKKR